MAGQVAIEIQWDGTTWVDETDHVLTASWTRGRGYASQVVALAGAGSANLVLRNDDGRYSYWEPTSPRYLQQLHGVGVRIRLVSPTPAKTLWTGAIDDPSNTAQVRAAPIWPVQCFGTFSRLTKPHTCQPIGSPGDTTDVLVGAVLDAAGWPSAERVIDTGVVTTGVWQPGSVEPLGELRKLEATELGFVYEGRDGSFHFEARDYRPTTTRANTSQLTLSDDPGADYHYRLLNLTAPEQYVYDRIKVEFTPVFTLDDTPVAVVEYLGSLFGLQVPAAGSRTFTIDAFHFYSSDTHPGATIVEWVDPTLDAGPTTSTIEIDSGSGAPSSDLTVSGITTTGESLTFTLTNGNPTLPGVILYVLLYGRRAVTGAPVSQIVGAGTREYPLPGSYYPDGASASRAARWLYNYFNQPRHLATVEIPVSRSDALLSDVFACDLSSRITLVGTGRLTKLGMTQDFYVEAERVSCEAHGRNLIVQWQCSAVLPNTQDVEDADSSLPSGLGLYYPMEQSSGDVVDIVADYNLTRFGPTTAIGIVGRGQQFVAADGDALFNRDSGLPDDHLNDASEWNGWLQIGANTGADQILLQKAPGLQSAYAIYTTQITGHQYIQAAVWNGTTLYTTTLNGHLLSPGEWHFFRLVHDEVNLRIGVSTDLGPFDWVTYTGTIVSPTTGIQFGSSGGALPTAQFDYWFRAYDLPGTNGDNLDTWPDLSGNGRDAIWPGSGPHSTLVDAGLGSLRVVHSPNALQWPEIALPNAQIFLLAKITAQLFTGTVVRTAATAGPNYGFGVAPIPFTSDIRPYVHRYSDNNNNATKEQTTVTHGLPTGWTMYVIDVDYVGATTTLTIDGTLASLQADANNLTGGRGLNPDALVTMDVAQLIIAHDLTPTEITTVQDALLYEAGLGGSPATGGKSLNGILDEWGFWPTRFLTDPEAASLYNAGAGTTSTGGTVNTTSPTSPPVIPGNVPSGTLADRPTAAPTNSLYFATDELGGTLYLMIGSTWTQVASGLTEDIPKALIDAKGDLITATADDTPARLAVGTNGQLLAANSSESTGLEWITHDDTGDPHSQYATDAEVDAAIAAAIAALPPTGQYRALLYSSPDGIHFDLIDDGAGHPVTVLTDLE